MSNRCVMAVLAVVGMAAGSALALPSSRTMNAQGDNASSAKRNQHIPGYNWDDAPISEFTAGVNQDLYEVRELIAGTATWLGPGPNDIHLILAGENPDWLEELRAEARLLAGRRAAAPPTGFGLPDDRDDLFDAWVRTASAVASPRSGGGDNRAHFVLNRWPVVETDNGFIGEVPYSFSDGMIAAWTNRFATTDATELNAVAGIANTFAVMLILEQELPIRFVGFNPNVHEANGILLMDNIGTGFPNAAEFNSVNRIGRASTAAGEDPTTMTHCSWQNFPSMIRSLGFVLGMDWEMRHPDRDSFIQVNLEHIPPTGFPTPAQPANGIQGPGITITPLGSGPLLYDQTLQTSIVADVDGCGFDLDSMMLIGPFEYNAIGPAYTILEAFRYDDLDGDGNVDTTPNGPDDRMFSLPPLIFFSDCDIEALTETYTSEQQWFFGSDENCFYNVDGDEVQDGFDAAAFVQLWLDGSPSADLVPPFNQVDQDDLDAFNRGALQFGVPPFSIEVCSPDPLPLDFRWFFGKNPVCPHDIDENEVQDGVDAGLYIELQDDGNPAADITAPWGVVDGDDLDAFFNGAAPDVPAFATGECVDDPNVVGWYYGKNPDCPHDVDQNLVQDSRDIAAFIELYNNGDFTADLVPPFGQLDLTDLQAFLQGQAPFTEVFTPGFCSDGNPPGPNNRPGRINPG